MLPATKGKLFWEQIPVKQPLGPLFKKPYMPAAQVCEKVQLMQIGQLFQYIKLITCFRIMTIDATRKHVILKPF